MIDSSRQELGTGAITTSRATSISFCCEYLEKDVDLSGKDVTGTVLIGANLKNANLADVDFLRGPDLSGTILTGANLANTHLVDADLSGKDLSGTNLSGADLRNADLSGTILTGANLQGADLRNAILYCINHPICN